MDQSAFFQLGFLVFVEALLATLVVLPIIFMFRWSFQAMDSAGRAARMARMKAALVPSDEHVNVTAELS
jgi:hypothetical protein